MTADVQLRVVALCANPATFPPLPHPVLGPVPICDRCRAKLEALT